MRIKWPQLEAATVRRVEYVAIWVYFWVLVAGIMCVYLFCG